MLGLIIMEQISYILTSVIGCFFAGAVLAVAVILPYESNYGKVGKKINAKKELEDLKIIELASKEDISKFNKIYSFDEKIKKMDEEIRGIRVRRAMLTCGILVFILYQKGFFK